MPPKGRPGDPLHDEIVAARELLRRLLRSRRGTIVRLRREQQWLEELEGRLDQLERDLAAHTARPSPPGRSDPAAAVRPAAALQPRNPLQRLAAGRSAAAVTVRSDGSGKRTYSIDGGPCFQLPPRLELLFELLIRDAGEGPDGLGRWVSVAEIRRELERLRKRPVGRAAVREAVRLLRAALLERANVNPYLLQTKPGSGYRFALRRAPRR